MVTMVTTPRQKGATVRFEPDVHHRLSVALARRQETLQEVLNRAVLDYLAESDEPAPEREEFVKLARRFWHRADPEVRQWIAFSMEQTIKPGKR